MAGEIQLKIEEQSMEPTVIETLLKSPEEDDAGFVLFDAQIQQIDSDSVEED